MEGYTSDFEEFLDRPARTGYGENPDVNDLDGVSFTFDPGDPGCQDGTGPEGLGDDNADPAVAYLRGLGDVPDNPMAESEEPATGVSDRGNTPPPPTGPGNEAAASGEERPDDLERAMDYFDSIQPKAFNSMLAAVVRHESLQLPSEEGPADADDHDDESLASFDAPDTEAARLHSDQEIVGMQYQAALDEAGLGIGSSAFTPGLVVRDGEAFARRLGTVPDQGHDTLRKGMADVVSRALSSVTLAHVPSIVDREYPGYYLEVGFQPDAVTDLEEYRQSTAQVLMHAQEIAEGLDNIGADPTIARDLRNAQTAEVEGMLPEWAMAQHMGLYDAPTTNSLRGWTQLVKPEEWQVLVDFIESASVKAPPHSAFVRTLAAAAADNIHCLRTGVLEPSKRSAMPPIEYEDDGISFAQSMKLREPSELDATTQERERQYGITLDAAEQRVRAVIARHDVDPIDK